jgi:hypothetical protein
MKDGLWFFPAAARKINTLNVRLVQVNQLFDN